MGMDLFGHGGMSLNWEHWRRMLSLAETYGWEPEGTGPSIYEINGELYGAGGDSTEWDGGYFSNSFQQVSDSDARGIAKALEAAINDVTSGKLVNFHGALDIRLLRQFADYCWTGGFAIG